MEVHLHGFLTSALDGGNGQLHAPAASIQGKKPLVHNEEEARVAPEVL